MKSDIVLYHCEVRKEENNGKKRGNSSKWEQYFKGYKKKKLKKEIDKQELLKKSNPKFYF